MIANCHEFKELKGIHNQLLFLQYNVLIANCHEFKELKGIHNCMTEPWQQDFIANCHEFKELKGIHTGSLRVARRKGIQLLKGSALLGLQ